MLAALTDIQLGQLIDILETLAEATDHRCGQPPGAGS
jgi:hypothetical protein